ncbi:MAG: hypothetical protein SFV15_26985 [Polyangiaceae bacterium]|nr:hypothetical protein [Polyangiaceae bacterium]
MIRVSAPELRRCAIAFGGSLMVALLSCHSEDFGPCHPEVATGDKFRVTLLEEWPENSQYAFVATSFDASPTDTSGCNYKPDLVPGTQLDFQVGGSVERYNAGCDARVGSVTVTGIVFGESGRTGLAAEELLVQSAYRATLPDGCTGGWRVGVVQPRGSAGRFSPAVAGQVPPLVVVREFQPDPNASCLTATEKSSVCLFAATAEPL